MTLQSRYRGALLGLACGDAVGTTLEFKSPGSFKPIEDMVGGGPFNLSAGQWTDDTSMALCLTESLVECCGFDAADQMRRYVQWWRNGYLSSTGRCFDIGNTVRAALVHFEGSGEPFSGSTDPNTAGNGLLMRLAPVPLFFARDRERALEMAELSSKTTHAAPQAIEACRIYADLILDALEGKPKAELRPVRKLRHEVRGSGYVVESMEAALWAFHNHDDFRTACLAAANLGLDADTTAAICGQLAGAYYGEEGILAEWLKKLTMADEIRAMADRLFAGRASSARSAPSTRCRS